MNRPLTQRWLNNVYFLISSSYTIPSSCIARSSVRPFTVKEDAGKESARRLWDCINSQRVKRVMTANYFSVDICVKVQPFLFWRRVSSNHEDDDDARSDQNGNHIIIIQQFPDGAFFFLSFNSKKGGRNDCRRYTTHGVKCGGFFSHGLSWFIPATRDVFTPR